MNIPIDNKCDREDCFAYKDGICQALTETYYISSACPFFKTAEQYVLERFEYEKRQKIKKG